MPNYESINLLLYIESLFLLSLWRLQFYYTSCILVTILIRKPPYLFSHFFHQIFRPYDLCTGSQRHNPMDEVTACCHLRFDLKMFFIDFKHSYIFSKAIDHHSGKIVDTKDFYILFLSVEHIKHLLGIFRHVYFLEFVPSLAPCLFHLDVKDLIHTIVLYHICIGIIAYKIIVFIIP